MLRQYAFIFLFFLLIFSVLFGCPSGQDDIKSAQNDVQSEQDDVKSAQNDVQSGKGDVKSEQDQPEQDNVKSAQDDGQSGKDDIKSEQDDGHQWNLPEGAIRRLGRGVVSEVAYSPDGGRLAVVAGSIGIWIYDAHTLNPVKLLTGHTNGVNSVSFSPDGNTIASVNDTSDHSLGGMEVTGEEEHPVFLWDVNTGRNIKTFTGHTYNVKSVSFSPDGNTIASGSLDGTVRLWDTDTGLLKTFRGDTSVSFSPDGKIIATGSEDGTVRLRDVDTGRSIKTLTGIGRVYSVSFSPAGNTIASINYTTHRTFGGAEDWEHPVLLWDVNTGRHIKTFTGHNIAQDHRYQIFLHFHPDVFSQIGAS